MDNRYLLGSRVPTSEHFETSVAQVLFDCAEAPAAVLSAPMQTTFLARLSRLLSRVALQRLTEAVPLLQRIDRDVLPRCTGPTRRAVLAMICDRAPHALSVMPQSSAQAHTLSRALFLSSVLHPQALRRIEQAVRAEGIDVGATKHG